MVDLEGGQCRSANTLPESLKRQHPAIKSIFHRFRNAQLDTASINQGFLCLLYNVLTKTNLIVLQQDNITNITQKDENQINTYRGGGVERPFSRLGSPPVDPLGYRCYRSSCQIYNQTNKQTNKLF